MEVMFSSLSMLILQCTISIQVSKYKLLARLWFLILQLSEKKGIDFVAESNLVVHEKEKSIHSALVVTLIYDWNKYITCIRFKS